MMNDVRRMFLCRKLLPIRKTNQDSMRHLSRTTSEAQHQRHDCHRNCLTMVVCFIILIVLQTRSVVALECIAPTPSSITQLSLAGCTASTSDVVVDVSQLGVGGTRTVTISNIALEGRALIVAGWLASNPTDVARVDSGTMTVTISGVAGYGRLLLSGNLPNMTTVTVTASTIALNTSVASAAADSAYGCSATSTVSSALCVVAPSLTFTLVVGTDVTLSNTWDPVVAGSAYSSTVAVASSLTVSVGDVGITGTLRVSDAFLGTIVASGDVARSAAAFALFTSDNIVAGTVSIAHTSLHVSVGATGVLAQGFTWAGGDDDVSVDRLLVGAHGNVSLWRSSIDVTVTSAANATSAVGLYFRGTLLLFSTGQVNVQDSAVTVLTEHPDDSGVAEGFHIGFVELTRGSILSISNSTWNVTSTAGNATMLYAPLNGRFPSVFMLYGNTILVDAPTANTTSSFMITYGIMTMESQLLLYGNSVVVLTNATDSITTPPVGIRISAVESTIGAVVTSPLLYGGTEDDGTLNISNGGTFSLVFSNFSFGDALIPMVLEGPLDIIIYLYPGCFMQLQDLKVYGGAGVVLFSRTFTKVWAIDLNNYRFTLGCFQFNDVYPVFILSQYFNSDILDIIRVVSDCACTYPDTALSDAYAVSGTYPNCHYTCQRTSSNPIAILRQQCAQPNYFSHSATITTKTMPPMQTATTYTEFISETKGSLTLSNSTTLPPTTSRIPSRSLTPLATVTARVSPTPTLVSTPSDTRTVNLNSFTQSLSASAASSKSRSRSLVPTHTRDLNATDSHSVTISSSASMTKVRATASELLTRHTGELTPSKDSHTPTTTLTVSMLATVTRYAHSKTITPPVPPPPFDFLVQSQALGFLTLALTSISTIISSNPTVVLTQFLAVMGQIYMTSDNAHQRTLPMAYILSPFWDYSKILVAVSNALIILGLLALHFVFAKLDVVGKLRGQPSAETVPPDTPRKGPLSSPNNDDGDDDAADDKKNQSTTSSERKPPPSTSSTVAAPLIAPEWVAARFPELSFSIGVVLYQGIVAAAFNIFYHESGAAFVIGTMCLLFTVALPLVEYWILYGFLKQSMPSFQRVDYQGTPWGRVLPVGYWARCRAQTCCGRIFDTMTDAGVKFTAYIFVVVLLVNAVAAVYASDQSERNAQYGILGVLFLIGGVFVAVFRPHRSMVTNIVVIAALVLLMMLCVCLANEATNVGAADGVPVLIVIIEVLLWCTGMYDIAVWYSESRGALCAAREAFERGESDGLMVPPGSLIKEHKRTAIGAGLDDVYVAVGDGTQSEMVETKRESATTILPPTALRREDDDAADMLYSPLASRVAADHSNSSSSKHSPMLPTPTDTTPPNDPPIAVVAAQTPSKPVAAVQAPRPPTPPANDDFFSDFLSEPAAASAAATSQQATAPGAASQGNSSRAPPSLGDFGRPPTAPPSLLDRGSGAAGMSSSVAAAKKPTPGGKQAVGVRPKAPAVSNSSKSKSAKGPVAKKPAGFSSSDDSDDSDL